MPMNAFPKRILSHLLILMMPIIALLLFAAAHSDSEDRIFLVFFSTIPFAALFFTVLGGAIFNTIRTIRHRKPTETLKAYWLCSAFVFLTWLGTSTLLLKSCFS